MTERLKLDRMKRNNLKVTNIVLIIIAILTVTFTITCLWLFYLYQSIPDTLVTCFYTSIVGELGVSGWIKVTKTKNKEKDYEQN